MIASLRRRHRRMTLALALTLLPVVILSLWLRRPITEMAPPLEPSSTLYAQYPIMIWESENLWPHLDMATRIFSGAQANERQAVELRPRSYLKYPELLVYFLPQHAAPGDRIPEDAVLLGTIADTETSFFPLPKVSPSAYRQSITLMIYSIAQEKIISSASFTIPAPEEERP